jgi:hypothetical protein
MILLNYTRFSFIFVISFFFFRKATKNLKRATKNIREQPKLSTVQPKSIKSNQNYLYL